LLELQDAASQAVVSLMPPGGRVLDFCAGGGGKSLALAMDATRSVFAHDANVARMRDLPERASRAGVVIEILTDQQMSDAPPFDVVLCDVPCSGSGAWRRNPDAKWTLNQSQVEALTMIQDNILDQAVQLLRPGGVLVFATCSVLEIENEARVAGFLARHKGWNCRLQRRFNVDQSGDGFFTAQLSAD
jgi:16S rRNA (cytosine967-C5)-methyltransferase